MRERVETERMFLYPLSDEEIRMIIEKESDMEMRQAYTEMLEGCLSNPDKRIWYAVWNMELKDKPGRIAGDFCFKGLGSDGVAEIGYGLKEEYRHQGYMTEAVRAITEWALAQENVQQVEAETDEENFASQKVLLRAGFVRDGKMGEEGPRFVYGNKQYVKETDNIVIRREEKCEYREVENLVRDSFWNVYRPGCLEHYVLHQLRNDAAFVPELDFVMYKDGELIGQNMFMRATITADDGRIIPIMTMGPICIKNELKRKGYGKILLDYSTERAKELGCGALCFEGNIDFYGKSGFCEAGRYGIRYHGLPEGEDASFFLCKELIPGYLEKITGEYATPAGYLVEEREAEEFDRQFPFKEKKKLPGQIF